VHTPFCSEFARSTQVSVVLLVTLLFKSPYEPPQQAMLGARTVHSSTLTSTSAVFQGQGRVLGNGSASEQFSEIHERP